MSSVQLPNVQSLLFSEALHKDAKKIALVLGNQMWPIYIVATSLPSQTVARIPFTLASLWLMNL